MDSKHIKVDKNQQIEKNVTHHLVFCMFLTMAFCPVLPAFAMAFHMMTT